MTAGDAIRILREWKGWSHHELALAATALRCARVTQRDVLATELGKAPLNASLTNVLLTVLLSDTPHEQEKDLALVTLAIAAWEAAYTEAGGITAVVQ